MSSWTPAEWATFFTTAAGFVGLIAVQITNVVVSIRNGQKTAANGDKIDANTKLTQITHDQVNGQTAALLKVTGDASFAAGQKDQLATQNAAEAAKRGS